MFKRVTTRIGNDESFEYYLMTNSEAVERGEALVFANGRLTKCGATGIPEFIAEASFPAGTNVRVPVTRVLESDEWETTAIATVAVTLIGSKVTLHTDGLQVTATTTSGVFLLSATDGVADGGIVRGYFRR